MFDLETTGIDVNTARIVTAYVGILEDGAMLQHDGEDVAASWLVDPGVPIPDEAAKVHGITTDHARAHGMNAGIAVDEIASALDPTRIEDGSADHFDALVAFNAAYDFTVLDRECERYGITPIVPRPVIDPAEREPHRQGHRGPVVEQPGSHEPTPGVVGQVIVGRRCLPRPRLRRQRREQRAPQRPADPPALASNVSFRCHLRRALQAVVAAPTKAPMTLRNLLLASCCSVLLAACSGDDDGTTDNSGANVSGAGNAGAGGEAGTSGASGQGGDSGSENWL